MTQGRSGIATEALLFDAGGPLPSSTSLVSSLAASVFGQTVTFTANVASVFAAPSGVVTFLDGGAPLGSAALDVTGRATFAAALLSPGAHTIVARYTGDLLHHASSSANLEHGVRRALTTTSLTSSSSPSIAGVPVGLTAIVSPLPPGTGAPSGKVTFADGSVALGTSSMGPGGVANLVTGSLAVGAHTLSASYSGDERFAGSTSLGLSQTVNREGATVTLASNANPSVFGAPVTFTALVAAAGDGDAPTGAVFFRDGFVVIATGTLDASGTATFETTALSGGSHTISASYGGDSQHAVSSVATVVQTVTPTPTSVALSAPVNPSVSGQPVTLTARVTAPPAGDFAGVITFLDGAAAIGVAPVDASGVAAVTTGSLSVGTHAITAIYGGDADHAPAASAALSVMVDLVRTTTAIAASSDPAQVGAVVTFTAIVGAVAPGTGVPTGTVTFHDRDDALGETPLDGNGVATMAVATLAAGGHPVTASYGGDPAFAPSASGAFPELIATQATTVAVISSPNPSTLGELVTLTATVTGSVTTATGKITFRDGGMALADAPLDATGTAVFSMRALSTGAHTLGAEYAGDAADSAGSGTVSHVVRAAPRPRCPPAPAAQTRASRLHHTTPVSLPTVARSAPRHREKLRPSPAATAAVAPRGAAASGVRAWSRSVSLRGSRAAVRHGALTPANASPGEHRIAEAVLARLDVPGDTLHERRLRIHGYAQIVPAERRVQRPVTRRGPCPAGASA